MTVVPVSIPPTMRISGSRLVHFGKMAAIGLDYLCYAIVWAPEPAVNFQAEGDSHDEATKVNLFFDPPAVDSSVIHIQRLDRIRNTFRPRQRCTPALGTVQVRIGVGREFSDWLMFLISRDSFSAASDQRCRNRIIESPCFISLTVIHPGGIASVSRRA